MINRISNIYSDYYVGLYSVSLLQTSSQVTTISFFVKKTN